MRFLGVDNITDVVSKFVEALLPKFSQSALHKFQEVIKHVNKDKNQLSCCFPSPPRGC
jgi:hypothetical protein